MSVTTYPSLGVGSLVRPASSATTGLGCTRATAGRTGDNFLVAARTPRTGDDLLVSASRGGDDVMVTARTPRIGWEMVVAAGEGVDKELREMMSARAHSQMASWKYAGTCFHRSRACNICKPPPNLCGPPSTAH